MYFFCVCLQFIQRLSDRTHHHIICWNKHVLYFLHSSLLTEADTMLSVWYFTLSNRESNINNNAEFKWAEQNIHSLVSSGLVSSREGFVVLCFQFCLIIPPLVYIVCLLPVTSAVRLCLSCVFDLFGPLIFRHSAVTSCWVKELLKTQLFFSSNKLADQ